jgi:uncharacterized protein (DUF305 family)
MKTWSRLTAVAVLLTVTCTVPTRPAMAQSASETPGRGEERGRPRHTEADVRFMQGMIPHHAQALDMTALVPARSRRRDLRLIAERIEVSQTDEIAWMTRWLQDRHAEVPDPAAHAHGAGHHGEGRHALMPGMLTPEEMAQLADATGPAFDRLFLQFMVRHHEGALLMVAELHATPGAAQATEVFRFAADVEADQQAEIGRMRALLDAPPLPAPHRP